MPGVLHAVTHQRNTAQRIDQALVADAAATRAAKPVVAGHEVAVADVQRGGHEAADIDLGTAGEQHAVGVGKKYLAVGIELAVNLARLIADDAVERHGAGVGLDEIDGGRSADIEALPIEGHTLAGLLHGEHVRRLADGGAARHHTAAGGQGVAVEGLHRCADEGDRGDQQFDARHYRAPRLVGISRTTDRAARALAAPHGALGHRHPGTGQVIPDQAVDAVHRFKLTFVEG